VTRRLSGPLLLLALVAIALVAPGATEASPRREGVDRPGRSVVAAFESKVIGHTVRGRRIKAWHLGDPASPVKAVFVGAIHGNEAQPSRILEDLRDGAPVSGADIWVVPYFNRDGYARHTRKNARGVDLNRNFPSGWRSIASRWAPQYSGPRPLSERESRFAERLILRLRPRVTIWFHQPQSVVRAWGPSVSVARRFARLARAPFRAIRWPAGTAPNWQNHRFPGTASFVVELPPGPLSAAAAARYARAILRLAD
jgi:protein MpaA